MSRPIVRTYPERSSEKVDAWDMPTSTASNQGRNLFCTCASMELDRWVLRATAAVGQAFSGVQVLRLHASSCVGSRSGRMEAIKTRTRRVRCVLNGRQRKLRHHEVRQKNHLAVYQPLRAARTQGSDPKKGLPREPKWHGVEQCGTCLRSQSRILFEAHGVQVTRTEEVIGLAALPM